MFSKPTRTLQLVAGAILPAALLAGAQTPDSSQSTPAAAPAPVAAAAPAPLSTFVLTGPLVWLPPAVANLGPFGKASINGIITGYAQGQNNPVPGDDTKQATLSNGEIYVQKADGKLQYFVQAGVYTMPTLGTPFMNAQDTVKNFYGPVPVAYLKLQTGKTTSWEIGSLPTLIGSESTFTYQNFDIQRGLVWAQENAVNRGLQVNQTLGKYLTASLSWNDGYYSNRYSWLVGSLTFTKGPNTLIYDGLGNLSKTAFQTLATPVQNNSSMHEVIYTYTKGSWIASAIYQYSNVPTNAKVGVVKGATTNGLAAYLSKSLKHGFALPGRFEYITQSGKLGGTDVNLLGFGPGSSGVTFTVTPTYQKGGFFFRADLGDVHAMNYTSGDVFGTAGKNADQFRAAGEFGFILGNNIDEK